MAILLEKAVGVLQRVLVGQPPFTDLEYVVEKLRREPVKLVLLVPRWPSKPWWKPLQSIAESHVVLPREETTYIPGKGLPVMPSPPWDSVLFKINTMESHREGRRDTTPRGLGIERWVWCDFKNWNLEVLRDHVALAGPEATAVRLAVGGNLAELMRAQGDARFGPKAGTGHSPAKSVQIKRSCTKDQSGETTQMKFRLRVRGSDGIPVWMSAIVDTGAETSLIKRGFMMDLMKTSSEPLRLVTATGDSIQGGDKEITLKMDFQTRKMGPKPGDRKSVG